MKIARHSITSDRRNSQIETATSLGASWVQFGNELLLYTDNDQWKELSSRAAQHDLQLAEHSTPLERQDMYLVVQKGRLFQQEHPDIPVILDHGRFLLVQVDPEQAQQFTVGDIPCYSCRPLENNQVVFDVAAPISSRAAIAWIQDLVDQVSQSTFEADLTHLVSYPTRFSTSDFYAEAAAWVQEQLSTMGYITQSQTITVGGSESQNIVADKLGSGCDERDVVLVVAHLDSINIKDGPSSSAPGADDNGSGSAGLLEIARVFQTHTNVHDLRFVFFGGEEQGLFGSKQYVASLTDAERTRIRAVINMDMIGCLNTTAPTVLLEGSPLSQDVIDGLSLMAATYTQLTVQTSLNPYASDHVPFLDAGIPAVLTIEGADGANDAIHSANDTIDRINYDLALEILRMNVAFIASTLS